MFRRSYDIIFALFSFHLSSALLYSKQCDPPKSCPGPTYYYYELRCTFHFEKPPYCCPTRWICDDWENLPEDECLVDGVRYPIGELYPNGYGLNGCYHDHCKCEGRRFNCTLPAKCSAPPAKLGCTLHTSPLECCKFNEVCEDDPVACIVDGKLYKIGESFRPENEPDIVCFCQKGYIGVNTPEFCFSKTALSCDNVLHHVEEILAFDPPYYGAYDSLYDTCNKGHVRVKDGEYVLEEIITANNTKESDIAEFQNPDNQCRIGNVTMNIGDKVRAHNATNHAVSCLCEVPPLPTCREVIPDSD
ncbi:uncharacterized protein [Venturia canescens]|uniref:uncharacterized protein isoform X2 n=1 Tax=Venturia canescens TaxID=32260 RepID=UPI001C9CE623|nr:uncharacterized protein LOC122412228 isoform X2 [Venturia canescens]